MLDKTRNESRIVQKTKQTLEGTFITFIIFVAKQKLKRYHPVGHATYMKSITRYLAWDFCFFGDRRVPINTTQLVIYFTSSYLWYAEFHSPWGIWVGSLQLGNVHLESKVLLSSNVSMQSHSLMPGPSNLTNLIFSTWFFSFSHSLTYSP